MMNAAERAVPFPQVEILPDRAPGRQVLRKSLPLTACPEHVEDGIEHLTDIHRPRPPTALGRTDQRRNERPFSIGEIALITQSTPIRCPPVLRLPHEAPRSKSGARSESQLTPPTQLLSGLALRAWRAEGAARFGTCLILC